MSLQHGGRVRHKKGYCPSRLGFRWVLFPPHGDVISIAHIKTSNIALRCPTRPPIISIPARKGLSSTISIPSAQPSVGIHPYRIRLSRDPHGKVSISDGYITSADDVFFYSSACSRGSTTLPIRQACTDISISYMSSILYNMYSYRPLSSGSSLLSRKIVTAVMCLCRV